MKHFVVYLQEQSKALYSTLKAKLPTATLTEPTVSCLRYFNIIW